MEEVKIFLAVPCYGGNIHIRTAMTILGSIVELAKRGIKIEIQTLAQESLIQRGRNVLTHKFLCSDATHLWFLDADLEAPPDMICKLIESGHDFVGAPYPLKRIRWDMLRQAVEVEKQTGVELDLESMCGQLVINKLDANPEVIDDFTRVNYIGTGFLLVKRNVFEKMAQAYPERIYLDDGSIRENMVDFWYCGIIDEPGFGRRFVSEDYGCCYLWRKLGGEIWAYTGGGLTHFGGLGFKGMSIEQAVDEETGERHWLLPVCGPNGVEIKAVPVPDALTDDERRKAKNKAKAERKRRWK